MTKRRKKPYDPAAAERAKREREENAEMIQAVRSQPSTAVNVCQRTGRITGAWRLSCFNTVITDPLHTDAVNWLDDLIRTANGENTPDRRPDYVRGSAEGAPGQNISQTMIVASETLNVVQDQLYPQCARLLFDLLKPDHALETSWRSVVEKHTGETLPHAQSAMVRAACQNLAWVKDNISRLVRERRERRMAA